MVTDNSGAKEAKCIKLTNPNTVANIGNRLQAVITKGIVTKKLKVKQIVFILVLRTKKGIKYKNGLTQRFMNNAGVIVYQTARAKDWTPRANRIKGPTPQFLNRTYYWKIWQISSNRL